MRKSIKAPLFSALVFPGSGHFVLRQPVRGALLVAVSFACLYLLIANAVEIAQVISDRLMRGEIPLDAVALTAEIEKQAASGETRYTSLATWGLVACWLIGIADSFRAGWLQDRADAERAANSRPG